MQNRVKTIFYIIASLSLIVVASGFYQPTSAQEYLDEEYRQEDEFYLEDEFVFDEGEIFPISGAVSGSTIPGSCIDGYKTWKKSSTYKANAPWSLHFMKRREQSNGYTIANYENERFIDLNGDGLVDYLFTFRQYFNGGMEDQGCVYLNNGAGFEKAYQCYAWITPGVKEFYGDCAQ